MCQIGERSEKVGKGLYRGIGSSIAHKCARSGGVPVSGSQQVGCFFTIFFSPLCIDIRFGTNVFAGVFR